MSGPVAAGLVLALGSAGALNWGFFVQHGAASALPPLSVRRPIHSLGLLFSNLRWLVGFVVGLGGWALYVGALALAPLSLVQAVSAGGIGLLALLVERTRGTTLSRREWAGVGVALAGLVLLGLSLAGSADSGRHSSSSAVAIWIVVSLAVAGSAAWRLPGGAGFGIAAGVLYAAGDVSTKAAVGRRRGRLRRRRARLPRPGVRGAPARLPAGRCARHSGRLDDAHERASDPGGDAALLRRAAERHVRRASGPRLCRGRGRRGVTVSRRRSGERGKGWMATTEHGVADGPAFTLSDEQRGLRDLAHEFALKEIRPKAAEYDVHMTHPADVIAKAHAVGLMNLHVPSGLGGPELGLFDGAVVGEELIGAAPGSGPRSARTGSAPRR